MNCRLVESRIDAYIDGELPGDEMLAVRHHVMSCLHCNEELETLKKVKMLVGKLPPRIPPPSFEERLWEAIKSAGAPKSTLPGAFVRLAVPATLAAAAAAMAVLVFSVFAGGESPDETYRMPVANASDDLARDQVFDQARNPLHGGIHVSLSRDPSGR